MEQCINCQTVYYDYQSDAELEECYCSEKCENEFNELMRKQIIELM